MMDNKELIWVEKGLAEQYKKLDSEIEKSKYVNKIIKDRKIDITSDIESLNDDLLRFRAFGLNYSTEFKKAYNEQVEKIEEFWNDLSEPVDTIRKQIRNIKDEISTISKDVENVSKKLEGLNTYRIERVIELIKTYNNMSENDKEIFKLILSRESE